MIDKEIIYAFIERWYRDTNSFHLPIGEMKITFDDVSSLLHMPIAGAFFSVNVFNKNDDADILVELLRVSHVVTYVEFNVTRTSTILICVVVTSIGRWLRENFFCFWSVAPCSTTRVPSQLALPILTASDTSILAGGYAWDVASLALLYDNLREPIMHQTRTVLRKTLDEIDVDEVCWTPYEEHRVKRPFEEVFLFQGWIRWGPKMYAHLSNKVLRQYGHIQMIHGSPLEKVGHTTIPDEMDIMFTSFVKIDLKCLNLF
uniref:Protein MAINTENANCE OF MERISTEMS-like n=1 Tax=Cicer arietinum TaxID=3827 RepID=A0A3Q7XVI2_CICAR|nr:protein MAINTENANCE OF MERISTEMS-like [Cicer arietinum]